MSSGKQSRGPDLYPMKTVKKKKISVRDRRINHTYFQLRFGLPSDHQYVLLNDPLGSCQITRKRIIKYKG